jgi:hypothetical protein
LGKNLGENMKKIFRVEFDEKWTGCKDWVSDYVNVLASDLNTAINKARKNSLGKSHVAEDSNKLEKCIGFRPTEVKLVAEAQI